MQQARQSAAWDHTALLAAVLAEPHRDRRRRPTPFEPADFHPFRKREAVRTAPDATAGIEILKTMFIDRIPQDAL